MASEASAADVLEALRFAAERHRTHKRKDGETPYVNHLIDVAELLVRVGGVRDRDVLVAAILHDTIEDTETRPEELAGAFGPRVAELVAEVSDDKSLEKQERKRRQILHAPELSRAAKLIKLADKISNLVDVAERPGRGWSRERRHEYFDWARDVVEGCRRTNAGLEARFDEVYAAARRRIA